MKSENVKNAILKRPALSICFGILEKSTWTTRMLVVPQNKRNNDKENELVKKKLLKTESIL